MAKVNLSNVSVDFETLLQELTNDLRTRNTWKDLLLSSTGTTILEYVASIGTFNQYNIEMAFREAFLSKALRDSSIYGISRMLGISVGRKIPAIVTVSLTNNSNDVLYIPALDTFTSSVNMINVFQTNIGIGQTQSVMMKVGKYKSVSYQANASIYNEYLVGEPGFIISDDNDLQVIVTDNLSGSEALWLPSDNALWMASETDMIYWATTTDTGDVAIMFGDGTYGMIPPLNSTITVKYITTDGTNSNISLLGSTVTYSKNKNVTGKVVDYFSSGVDQKPSLYYKLYAPHMFKARGRCNTKTDYISNILGRSDVAGVSVQAQRDLYPGDPMWMNTLRICILAAGTADNFGGVNPAPKSAKWTDFLNWLDGKSGALMKIQPWNPTPKPVVVSVNIAMLQTADSDTVKALALANLNTLFQKDMYSLGKAIYLSDIDTACKVSGVDYVDIISPKANIVPADVYTYATLASVPTIQPFYSERTSLPTYQK